jgi:hypothetical protein
MKFYFILFLVLNLICSSENVFSEEIQMKVLKSSERTDRVVDRAAVAIQREAIKRIESILDNPMHKSKEADLLFQLSVARLEAASIQFRISHEIAHRGDSALDLSSYNREMGEAVKVLTRFLDRYPRDPRIPEVLFLRGTAFDESKQTRSAKKDFEELVKRFPEVPETSSAYMRLSDLAVEDENHSLALTYLNPMEKRPNDAFYPFALYKMAWAHFNLNQIRTALDYLGKHIHFYDQRFQTIGGLESSEMAIRDNSIRDISLFYMEGIQKKNTGFRISAAFDEFKKYAGINPTDPIIVRFTSLLRARNEKKELEEWANKIFLSDFRAQTKLSVLNILFENQNNRRLYADMGPNLLRLTQLITDNPDLEQSDAAIDLKRIVEQGAKDLHKAINDNKKSPDVVKLLASLEEVYGLVIALSIKDKRDSVKSYFNLAETYFELKNYAKATHFYELARLDRLQVAKTNRRDQGLDETIAAKDLHLRSLASQFEQLKLEKIIPQTLATQKESSGQTVVVPRSLVLWEETLKKLPSTYALNNDEILVLRRYQWEAQRARYKLGQVTQVLEEFSQELEKQKNLDDIQAPKLALWMDTLVLSEKWADLHSLTKRWNKNPSIKKLDLADKMKELESDSFLKQLEALFKAHKYEQVLEEVALCQKNYAAEEAKLLKCQIFKAEVLLLQAQHQPLLVLLEKMPYVSGDVRIQKRILEMREEAYFAQQNYEKLYDLVIQNQGSDTQKILDMTFMIQEPRIYRSTLAHNNFCKKQNEDCRMLRAILKIRGDEENFSIAFGEIFRAHRPYRSLYSLASASSFRSSLGDRMKVMRNAFDSWKDLDPRVYWSVLPYLDTWLDAELQENRRLLQRNYPLKADSPDSLVTRFSRVKDFETSLELMAKTVPFSFLKNRVILGASGSLDDLIVEMNQKIGTEAQQFVGPLQKKKKELEAQILVLSEDQIKDMNARMLHVGAHVMDADSRKIIKDLEQARWVAAKTHQNEARTKKKLSPLATAWLDASFFIKLGAYEEAQKSLELAEVELGKILLTQQQVDGRRVLR